MPVNPTDPKGNLKTHKQPLIETHSEMSLKKENDLLMDW